MPLITDSQFGSSFGDAASAANSAVASAASSVASGAANIATGGFTGFLSWLQSGKGISFILGIILIIVGLFQFKYVREVTGYAAKGAVIAA
jgi:hypothetical protein